MAAMTDEKYSETQQLLEVIASVALTMDLEGFLHRIRIASAAGPVLNPTLWLQGHEKLEQVRELAEALHRVQGVARRHVEVAR